MTSRVLREDKKQTSDDLFNCNLFNWRLYELSYKCQLEMMVCLNDLSQPS